MKRNNPIDVSFYSFSLLWSVIIMSIIYLITMKWVFLEIKFQMRTLKNIENAKIEGYI